MVNFFFKKLSSWSPRPGPGRSRGTEIVGFLLRIPVAGAPELVWASAGPDMVSFLLRIPAAGASELASAGPGPEMVSILIVQEDI